MSNSVQSKAGLIGYLQGTVKGTVSTIKGVVESKDTTKEEFEYYLKLTLAQLQKMLVESEEIWQRVKHD